MIKFIKTWYQGETKVETHDHLNDTPGLSFLPFVYTEYHWTARIVRSIVGFSARHWQFLITTAIGIGALWVAALALKP